LIPVGDDQLPHIEQTRKIVRRFNELYGKGKDILTVPEALLSEISRLPGIDGNAKMGKSLGNAIYLSDNKEIIDKKVRMAKTDTNRIHLNDKGNPQVCTVATYHKAFNLSDYGNLCEMCKNATIGCSACKKELADALNKELEPFRERRAYYEERPKIVGEIIAEGSRKANIIGDNMVLHVKDAMHLLI